MRTEAPAAFFSYSREDSEFALRLAADLKAGGADVWLDQLDIEAGQEWDSTLEEALAHSPCMLLILSPASVKSKNVRNEIAYALDERKTIIPVLYSECIVPLQLHRVQYIDFRSDYSRGLSALLKALRMQAPSSASRVASFEPAPPVLPSSLKEERKQTPEVAPSERPQPKAANLEVPRGRIPVATADSDRRSRTGMIVALAACGVLVASVALYFAIRPRQPDGPTGKQESHVVPVNPPLPANQGGNADANPGGVTPPQKDAGKASNPQPPARTSTGKAAAVKPAPAASIVQPAANKEPVPAPLSAQEMEERGVNYYSGTGVPQDYGQALSWFRKAADAGDSGGMRHLGVMYAQGQGVAKDPEQAVSWFRKGADAGNTKAMLDLALTYSNGHIMEKNYSQAAYWYRKAADGGEVRAMDELGVLYAHGTGVQKDLVQAVYWFRRGADAGMPQAMANLGICYANGDGVPTRDYQQALSWYRKAADMGNADGLWGVGSLYKNGLGVNQDYAQAVDWFRRSADAGSTKGMNGLASMYENGWGVHRDHQQAITWYRKAAQMGSENAEAALRKLGVSPQ